MPFPWIYKLYSLMENRDYHQMKAAIFVTFILVELAKVRYYFVHRLSYLSNRQLKADIYQTASAVVAPWSAIATVAKLLLSIALAGRCSNRSCPSVGLFPFCPFIA